MDNGSADVFLGVGSNIHPAKNILAALTLLASHVRIRATSTFYRSAPVGGRKQPAFFNGVWRVETTIAPRSLKFSVLRVIEESLGRVRTADAYVSRTIDLDIVLYGSAVVTGPDLRIPDPAIRTRPFIAVPLLELEPQLVLPDTGEALSSLVSSTEGGDLEAQVAFTARLRERVRQNERNRTDNRGRKEQ